jgi:restriction system protein
MAAGTVGPGRSNAEKWAALNAVAARRKTAHWPGYWNLSEIWDGNYECDYVSPFTKGAHNLDTGIFVMLQDWCSEGGTSANYDGANDRSIEREIGYTPNLATNRNLTRLLQTHFELPNGIPDVYGTNVFPFIKPGGMSAPIPWADLQRAAQEFALPQIEAVQPKLVIALGKACFNALQGAAGVSCSSSLAQAIAEPFPYGATRIWCQAHTGWGARHRGGAQQVEKDWAGMADWFRTC